MVPYVLTRDGVFVDLFTTAENALLSIEKTFPEVNGIDPDMTVSGFDIIVKGLKFKAQRVVPRLAGPLDRLHVPAKGVKRKRQYA